MLPLGGVLPSIALLPGLCLMIDGNCTTNGASANIAGVGNLRMYIFGCFTAFTNTKEGVP